jgi:hypothetical protein
MEVEVLFGLKVKGKNIKGAGALFFSFVLTFFLSFAFLVLLFLQYYFHIGCVFFLFFSFYWLCSSNIVILVLFFLHSHYYLLTKMRRHNNINNMTNRKPFPRWCCCLFALVLLPSHINGGGVFPC